MKIASHSLRSQIINDTGHKDEQWDPSKSPEMREPVDAKTQKFRERVRRLIHKDEDRKPVRFHKVGVVSEKSCEIEVPENTPLDPGYVRRSRNLIRRDAELFLKEHPESSCYTAIVTSGKRCASDGVGDRLNSQMEKASRLCRLDLGVDLVLRTAEVAYENESGKTTAHVHLHLLFRSEMPLSLDQMRCIEKLLSDFFGGIALVKPVTGDPLNVINYMLKEIPSEDLTDEEFIKAYYLFKNRKMVQPLGEFKKFRKVLKQKRLAIYTRHDGELTLFPKCNLEWKKDKRFKKKEPLLVNIVLKFLPPRSCFTGYTEPILLVKNYNGDFNALLEANPFLREFVSEARMEYERKRRKVA